MADPRRLSEAVVLEALGSVFDADIDAFRAALAHPGVRLLHGDLPRWRDALEALPNVPAGRVDASAAAPAADLDTDADALAQTLQNLAPWRKGPWRIGAVTIDSEWRSDLKFARLQPHIAAPAGRRILDVGGGNGYFTVRLAANGAASVLNVDPTLLFFFQFAAVQRFLSVPTAGMLPVPFEALAPAQPYDTVLSMGVLYHRRAPLDHLHALHAQLRPGGELVLETLITRGDERRVLIPADRYARMRNVWFLPTLPLLEDWLRRAGFEDIRLADVSTTTTAEQRATPWMTFDSLTDALEPEDASRTIEGHPAPRRALLLANRPD